MGIIVPILQFRNFGFRELKTSHAQIANDRVRIYIYSFFTYKNKFLLADI